MPRLLSASMLKSPLTSIAYFGSLTIGSLLFLIGCSSTSKEAGDSTQNKPSYSIGSVQMTPSGKKDAWGNAESAGLSRNRPVAGTKGMVVSDDAIASEWGAQILRKGGNAVDAAVATAFALAVTRPHYASLGGGGFALICPAPKNKRPSDCKFIDYREVAPKKATRELFLKNGKADTKLSQDTALGSGVPGVPAGLLLAHAIYGKKTRQELLREPIQWANAGIRLSTHTVTALVDRWDVMNDAGKKIFGCPQKGSKKNSKSLKDKIPCPVGTKIIQKDLAKVLKAIADQGGRGFYTGWVAKKISKGIQDGGGIITESDLAAYAPRILEPVSKTFEMAGEKLEVLSSPPPSSGGAILLQLLTYANLARQQGFLNDGYYSVATQKAFAHAMSLAFADRAQFFGDPDFYEVPLAGLLNDEYLKERWKTFRVSRENFPEKEGNPRGFAKGTADHFKEGMETTHFSVVDKWGNAVSITTTVNDNFGNAFIPEGTGVVMNNEMDDFSLEPGVPNLFGLVGTEANAVQSGKKPLSSMSPTIVRNAQSGEVRVVLGGQGGPRIPTSTFQVLAQRFLFHYSIADSVSFPRMHHQWKPKTVLLEEGLLDRQGLSDFEKSGYSIKLIPITAKIQALERFDTGEVWGASDPRGEGRPVAE